MTHICVSKLTIIGSDNGLSPDRRQAIIWTNAGLLLIEPLGTNFSEILIEILTFSLKKMRLKVSSAKRRPFCLGLNGLMIQIGQFYFVIFGKTFYHIVSYVKLQMLSVYTKHTIHKVHGIVVRYILKSQYGVTVNIFSWYSVMTSMWFAWFVEKYLSFSLWQSSSHLDTLLTKCCCTYVGRWKILPSNL